MKQGDVVKIVFVFVILPIVACMLLYVFFGGEQRRNKRIAAEQAMVKKVEAAKIALQRAKTREAIKRAAEESAARKRMKELAEGERRAKQQEEKKAEAQRIEKARNKHLAEQAAAKVAREKAQRIEKIRHEKYLAEQADEAKKRLAEKTARAKVKTGKLFDLSSRLREVRTAIHEARDKLDWLRRNSTYYVWKYKMETCSTCNGVGKVRKASVAKETRGSTIRIGQVNLVRCSRCDGRGSYKKSYRVLRRRNKSGAQSRFDRLNEVQSDIVRKINAIELEGK